MRTEVRRRIQGEGTAGTICTSESGLRASEVRERFRPRLRLEFLSIMALS